MGEDFGACQPICSCILIFSKPSFGIWRPEPAGGDRSRQTAHSVQHQTGTPFQAFSRINPTASAFPSRIVSSAVVPSRSGCGVFSQARIDSGGPENSWSSSSERFPAPPLRMSHVGTSRQLCSENRSHFQNTKQNNPRRRCVDAAARLCVSWCRVPAF